MDSFPPQDIRFIAVRMKHPIYRTASGTTPGELDEKVNSLLAEGFGLYGAPYSVRNEQGFPALCQAMTKDTDAEGNIGFGFPSR
jgi:hypothetical protein